MQRPLRAPSERHVNQFVRNSAPIGLGFIFVDRIKNLVLLAIVASVGAITAQLPGGSVNRSAIVAMLVVAFGGGLIWAANALKDRRLKARDIPTGVRPTDVFAELEVLASQDAVRSHCLDAIKSLPNVDATAIEQRASGVLCVRTKHTFKTWGERVTVEIDEGMNASVVRLRSKPVYPFMMNDWDMNFQNVYLIAQALQGETEIRIMNSNVVFDFK